MRSASFPAAALAALLIAGSAQAQQPQPDPQQQQQGEKATPTRAGNAGAEEPSAHAPSDRPMDMEPLAQGRWNVPGAPADSQTVPAKFSERNAWVDSLPIMAAALIWLDDSERQQIADAIGAGVAPAVDVAVKPAEELPADIERHQLPDSITNALPGLRGFTYVRTNDSVLIVRDPNSIVVGEIPLASGTTGSGVK